MAYKIKITSSADKDLDEIISYILNELCNPQAAKHLLDEISKTYHVLADNPRAFPVCSQKLLQRYRKIVIMNYIIIYRIDGTDVFIERFFSRLEDYARKL